MVYFKLFMDYTDKFPDLPIIFGKFKLRRYFPELLLILLCLKLKTNQTLEGSTLF